jgi:hypothetical protein
MSLSKKIRALVIKEYARLNKEADSKIPRTVPFASAGSALDRIVDLLNENPEPEKGWKTYNTPGACQLCGSLTCSGSCFK